MFRSKEQKLLARLEGENVEEKIEVIAREDSASLLEIRSVRWGRGLGWYVQKTITLDPTQVKMLTRVLRRSAVASATKNRTGNVCPFPTSVLRR